jgi:antirestriction protein ArdC
MLPGRTRQCFLAADLEFTAAVRDDHASWLQVLKRDKRAIFSAAAHAHRAVDFLHALQQSATEPA